MYMLDVTGVLCVRSWQWPVYCSRAENILIIDLSKPCDTLCSCVCVCGHARCVCVCVWLLYLVDGRKQ